MFKKIYEIENTKYSLSLMGTGDSTISFLKVDSYEDLPVMKRRLFRKPVIVNKRTLVHSTMIPLSATVHLAMVKTLMLRHIADEEVKGILGNEDDLVPIYQVIDDSEHKTIIDEFRKLLKDSDDGDRYRTPANPPNKVARGFKNEGYNYLGVELINSISRVHTLYKTSKYGYVMLALVKEVGKPNDMYTTEVETISLTRELIDHIFYYMGFYEGVDNND